MRWSNYFVPTLRDVPSEAEAVSHGLLVQAGFIRQLQAGHYSMMPLGRRVQRKVEQIIREEIDALGGQEMMLPTVTPADIWKKSGRWDTMGEIMFRLSDRRGNENALSITHEEVFSTVASELTSYKQLPQLWYHIQLKYRDEARPKSGLLRVREFHMKDSYSFDVDQDGLDKQFDAHYDAYLKIFSRLGLEAFGVEASNGAMGGSDSVEFMVECPAGEDDVIKCTDCEYAANIEKAQSKIPKVSDETGPDVPEMFDTPGVRTIAALAELGHTAQRQLKTLVMVADGETILAVLRGDHQLSHQKLSDQIGGPVELRPATPEEAKAALGAMPGSLGAVAVDSLRTIVDVELKGRTNMTTGANIDDKHLEGVNVERDISSPEWLDIREAKTGEACIKCGGELGVLRCVEAGHIFKLGYTYAEKFGIKVATPDGDKPVIMGSYGIGVERNMATVVESHHDDKGIVWPMSVAPFEVVITPVKSDDDTMAAANKLYEELNAAGVEVILDDRDARAGVKFADAELVGFPLRITLGPKALADNSVELSNRATGKTELVGVDKVVSQVAELVAAAKAVS